MNRQQYRRVAANGGEGESETSPSLWDKYGPAFLCGALLLAILGAAILANTGMESYLVWKENHEECKTCENCAITALAAEAFIAIIENCTGVTSLDSHARSKNNRARVVGMPKLGDSMSTFNCQQVCVNTLCNTGACNCVEPVSGGAPSCEAQLTQCCIRQEACCIWNCAVGPNGIGNPNITGARCEF